MWRCLVPKKYPSRHIGLTASPSQRLPSKNPIKSPKKTIEMGMGQYLLIPSLVGWTSIYQLFWCSPGVQGFDPSPSHQTFPWLLWQALATHTHCRRCLALDPFLCRLLRPKLCPVVRHCNRLRRHGFRGVRWGRGGPGLSRNKISGQWEVWKNTAVIVQF